jgi:2-keto-4-pentenoate hydratase/2-oxohepta-3-ene-1,7-dioic acid hydratase in catechol pathway
MRFFSCMRQGMPGTGILRHDRWHTRFADEAGWPGTLDELVEDGTLFDAGAVLASAPAISRADFELLPPLGKPGKLICIGLNYREHTAEVAYEQPAYPTIFTRFSSTLVGDGAPLICPQNCTQFDYEGEIAAIIGTGGRHISRDTALDHIIGWSLFNDASARDYQFKTPQWTVGKNFDSTGGFGPLLVTHEELPRGLAGVRLETRLNGTTVQSALADDMVFDVATLIEIISEVMTLDPGDVIVTGTPAGVGMARTPPLWMKASDIVEVEASGLGILRNTVVEECLR